LAVREGVWGRREEFCVRKWNGGEKPIVYRGQSRRKSVCRPCNVNHTYISYLSDINDDNSELVVDGVWGKQ
jgi:hypothetical protein